MSSSSNLPSVDVADFVEIVKMQLEERNFRPIFGLGKGGIGKTESIEELAHELGIGYIDIRLLLYSETDLKGIPYPNAEHTKTVWLENNILPNAERDGDKGILVFDEITSCNRSVRTAAYQLLNERRLGEYVLPKDWLVVCLGNGEDDGGDFQGMEGNFANRCSVFNVVPNVDAWKNWAFNNGVNPLVTGYISFKPSDLHSYNPESETEILFASPRSWTAVSNILNTHEYNDKDTILHSRIIANLGQRVGQQFIAFCKFKDKTVEPMDILEKGETPEIDNTEILYITIQSVVKIMGDNIVNDYETTKEFSEKTLDMVANGLRWLFGLKVEYAAMGFKDLVAYGSKHENAVQRIVMSPELNEKCPELKKFAHDNIEVFK